MSLNTEVRYDCISSFATKPSLFRSAHPHGDTGTRNNNKTRAIPDVLAQQPRVKSGTRRRTEQNEGVLHLHQLAAAAQDGQPRRQLTEVDHTAVVTVKHTEQAL
jgi:hypothetical protein